MNKTEQILQNWTLYKLFSIALAWEYMLDDIEVLYALNSI